MCAYQRVDGEPCCAHTRYEQQILRDEWGFNGLITSDCGAINDFLPRYHNVVETPQQAVAIGVRAGTDVECGSLYRYLPEAVKNGWVSEEARERIMACSVQNLRSYVDGDPINVVNRPREARS